MKKICFIALLLCCSVLLNAQTQLGWRTDSYAGINATLLNPAMMSRTPYAWDVNLAEVDFSIYNNYAFLENTGVFSLLKAAGNDNVNTDFRGDLANDVNSSDQQLVYDFKNNENYNIYQQLDILGPSFSFRLGPLTRIGAFTRWRTMGHARDFDADLGYYRWEDIASNNLFQLDAANTTWAAWSEIGLSLSQGFYTATGELHIGANVRRLTAKRAVYFSNAHDFELSKLPDDEGLEGSGFDIQAGFSNNLLDGDDINSNTGNGWGFDLGVLYKINMIDDYAEWELGLAVLDVGKLNITDAQKHRFNQDVLITTLSDHYDDLPDDLELETIAQTLSEDVFSDSLASLQANEFSVALPSRLHAHVAYNFNEWAKVEASILLPLVGNDVAQLGQASVIGIVPRIDRHWWSVAMPISYYAGQELRLGLSARLGPLFIGTDHFGSFLKQKEFKSTDFYVGLKVFPFALAGGGSGKSKSFKRRTKGKDVKCYNF